MSSFVVFCVEAVPKKVKSDTEPCPCVRKNWSSGSWCMWCFVQWSKGANSLGLSYVVHRLFGKPLDKSMQISNWERRPLSPWQIQYAAQDAHVLLSLYKCIIANEAGVISVLLCHLNNRALDWAPILVNVPYPLVGYCNVWNIIVLQLSQGRWELPKVVSALVVCLHYSSNWGETHSDCKLYLVP